MLRFKSLAAVSAIAASMMALHADAGLADELDDLRDDSSVYSSVPFSSTPFSSTPFSRIPFGSSRAAPDFNRWQLDSGLMSNESLIDQRTGGEDLDDSYSGLRLRLPLGRQ